MADKRDGMTTEQLSSLMAPALFAMAEKRDGMTTEANCAYYVCTIYNEAVLIDKSLSNFKNHLGQDSTTVEAITTAITKYGYYAFFGHENCKLTTLEDWIERAPKVQRGKNGHLYLCICYFH